MSGAIASQLYVLNSDTGIRLESPGAGGAIWNLTFALTALGSALLHPVYEVAIALPTCLRCQIMLIHQHQTDLADSVQQPNGNHLHSW
ncbi:MAG: hypothetical protein HC833_17230 [Leptolyngbyaceae cyanobacterium RM1_406_9]|nr:hypothetical protein [Leptolyngbyaceae cyanobacterium RM1_406_9]